MRGGYPDLTPTAIGVKQAGINGLLQACLGPGPARPIPMFRDIRQLVRLRAGTIMPI